MKCHICKGTGVVKKKHPVTLNWPVAVLGFIFGDKLYQRTLTEKRPGKIQETKTCPKCKGTGQV